MAWVGRVVSAGPGKLEQTAPWIGESSVSDHRQYSSAELNTQGKALPLYHLRCRGMTNAYFGDPGKPGVGLHGGEDSRRRAELEKLYPAEIEERIRGIQSGADWPESSRRGLDWHYEKHREDLELSAGDEWSLDQYQAESLRVVREADRVMTYHKPGTTDTVRWGFYESASGLYAAVDGQTGYIATCYRPEEMKFDDAVEVIK